MSGSVSTNTAWVDDLTYDRTTGLLPCIVQDVKSREVLMLAYMNRESILKTLETGQTWFWSRSRQELWNKGATSGHVQQVVRLSYDCDRDTLLAEVEQTGAACHTGAKTCFFETVVEKENETGVAGYAISYTKLRREAAAKTHANSRPKPSPADATATCLANRFAILDDLLTIIADRDAERPEGAYTTYLFEKGLEKILKKVGEESAEVVIAAMKNDRAELTAEVGDVIYHLFVLLQERKLPFDEVLKLLEERHTKKDIKNKA
ncbi:MAG TPA: bifunctional phosphoribosyl-AMP cyclohydrolase/phosphoribosyl-ATP diphosphatase HisIE [Bacilli bacterium]|nr:bifunctional phosphoribosyl-AMP cyclohydrolase/phosphoribosyl-ATP diphosphatase HisIE [Bacilli bacterium]